VSTEPNVPDDAEETSAPVGRDLDAGGGASPSGDRDDDEPAGTDESVGPDGSVAAEPATGSDTDTPPDDDADPAPTAAGDDLDDDEVDRRFRQILGQLGGDPEDTYRASALGTAPVERPASPPRSTNPSAAARAAHPSFTPREPGLMFGWLLAVGPVVLGIVLGVLGHTLTVPWMLLGLAVTITGVVLLVRRMSNESPGGDGGAVV
jgi:hypothetical protein